MDTSVREITGDLPETNFFTFWSRECLVDLVGNTTFNYSKIEDRTRRKFTVVVLGHGTIKNLGERAVTHAKCQDFG